MVGREQEAFGPEYGHSYGPGDRQKLDLYPPRLQGTATAAPIFVYLYGGSWKSGSRRIYRFLGHALSKRGFFTAIPDYRVFPEVRFPAFLEDAAAAIAAARGLAEARGGDPNRLILAGHSAGAHMALTLGLDARYLRAAGVPMEALKGLAGLAGPYSFNPLETASVRDIFKDHAPIADARPIKLIRGAAPPTLLLHGSRDATVGKHNTEHLSAALTAMGVDVRTRIYGGIGHIEIMAALAAPYRWRAPVFWDLLAFAREVSAARLVGTSKTHQAAQGAA